MWCIVYMDIDAQMHPSLHLWMNVSYMVWVDTKNKGLKEARPIGRGYESQGELSTR